MPLHDHFRPPVRNLLPWASLHSGWISEIASRLNDHLPPGYVALDRMYLDGGLEIDIGTCEQNDSEALSATNGSSGGGLAVETVRALYTPPAAMATTPFDFPNIAEVRVFTERGSGQLVGAIELVSPANKDRGTKRDAFVAKCLDYLASGVSLVIVDVVTDRHAILHNEIVAHFDDSSGAEIAEASALYAASYRPVIREKRPEIDIWCSSFAIGDTLPTMPLRLVADYFVPVELEATYVEACRRRKLIS